MKDTAIIIVQHGDFPFDFKEKQKAMFDFIEGMLEKISDESRSLPRNGSNDCNGNDIGKIADAIRKIGGFRYLEIGYMEFAPPTIEQAVEKLESLGLKKIVFVNTPGIMMRSSHSMMDVPGILESVANKHPGLEMLYAKPGIDFDAMADVFIKRITTATSDLRPKPKTYILPPQKDDFGVVLIAHGDIPLEYLKDNKNVMGGAEEHIEAWSRMVCEWPRSEENDPLWFDTKKLEQHIREKGGYDNFEVGNLEFAQPTLKEALDKVVGRGAKKVLFFGGTGFMDRSSHTLMDIPEAIKKLKTAYPGIELTYVYPDVDLVCDDLAFMIAAKVHEAIETAEVHITADGPLKEIDKRVKRSHDPGTPA